MSNTVKLVAAGIAFLFLVGIVVAAVAAYGVIQRMNQVIADQQEIIKGAQDIIKASKLNQENIESQRKVEVSKIESSRKAVKTPEQAVKVLPVIIPGVTPQLVPSQQPEIVDQAQREGKPIPVVAEFPPEQLKILSDFAYACQQCKTNLDAALAHNVEDDTRIVAMQKEIDSTNKQLKAARGGSFFDKFKRNLKTIAGSVAVGVVIGLVLAG